MLARLGVFAGGCTLESPRPSAAAEGMAFGEVVRQPRLARRQEPRPPEGRRRRRAAVRPARDDPRVRARAARGTWRARGAAPAARRALPRAGRGGGAGADAREPGACGSTGSTRRTTTSAPRSPGRSGPARSSSALRMAGALVRFWSTRGLMREGRARLAEALAAPRVGGAGHARKGPFRRRVRGRRRRRLPGGEGRTSSAASSWRARLPTSGAEGGGTRPARAGSRWSAASPSGRASWPRRAPSSPSGRATS